MIVTQEDLKAEHNSEQPTRPSDFVPLVKTQCTCRNSGKPDKDWANTDHNPSCCVSGHGTGGRYVPRGPSLKSSRRVGRGIAVIVEKHN